MMRTAITAALTLLLASAAAAQQAQPEQPAANPPAQAPPSPAVPSDSQPSQPQPAPTLDDLLGITPGGKPGSAKPAPPPQDPAKAALEQKLTNKEISQAFVQAVALMGQTAERIQESRDTSITTQRMQEDVIRKLDVLIAQAQKQKSQSRSQSKSNQEQDPRQQPQQQQQSQNSGKPDGGQQNQAADPPPGSSGQLGPEMAQGAAWGALPGRVRDALLQGNADKYSAMYQKWTEAYYRRIAEEAGK